MTSMEFNSWIEFYKLFPFDDYHRYYRPAALISCSMAAGEIKGKLDWLQPEPVNEDYSQADMNTFKAFGVKPPR